MCEVLYCCLPAFAMPGALAWQVTKPNKDAIFVFGGEMVRGFLPDSPLCVCLWPPFFSRTVCKIYSDKRLIKFGVNVPERWFRYPQSYSSALPFQWIGMSCTINTTMDRRILGIFSSTLLSKVHL